MRRVFLLAAACLLLAGTGNAAEWNSLHTEHFLLLGDASPGVIKEVALRFEQFRAAVTSTFSALADNRPGPPVIVIVFAFSARTSRTSRGSTARPLRSADISSAAAT
jgi:hypothetical protein